MTTEIINALPIISDFTVQRRRAKEADTFKSLEAARNFMRANPGSVLSYKVQMPKEERE